MANRLEVEIGGKIKDFQNKVAQALKLTDKLKAKGKELEKSYKAGEISADKYYNSLAQNASRLAKVSRASNTYKKSLNNVSNGMQKTTKSVANGTSAMTAFSRTVQDAPFGMMGVSNNITNLTEQFGYLKKRTGSTSGALKAMLTDLKGFGGITLGISLLTSAWLMFGDKISFATDKAKEFKEALSEVSTSSIIEFQVLTSVLNDTTASQKEQAKAVQILKDKYSDFDTSLLTTKGNYEDGKKAIDDYILSLVQQAKAQAAMSLIEKKYAKIIQAEEKKNSKMRGEFGSATEEQFEERRKRSLEIAEKVYSDAIKQGRKLNNINLEDLANLRENVDKHKKTINDRYDAVKNMGAKEIALLESEIFTLTSLANIRDLILFGKKGKGKGKGITKDTLSITPLIKADDKGISNQFNILFDNIATPVLKLRDDIGGLNVLGKIISDEDILAMRQKLEMITVASQIASNAIGQSFNQMTSGIKNNLTEQLGVMGTFLGYFVDFISQMLQSQIQQFLIERSLAAKSLAVDTAMTGKKIALDKAKATSNAIVIGTNQAAAAGPVGGILLPLLIGGAIAAVGSAFGGLGGGGTSNAGASSSSGGSSFNGGASISQGAQRVVFEIAGTRLVGVINNTLRQNGNTGGTLSFS